MSAESLNREIQKAEHSWFSLPALFAASIAVAMTGSFLAFHAEEDRDIKPYLGIQESPLSSSMALPETGKMLAPLQIKLSNEGIPDNSSEECHISAVITTTFPTLPELAYEWQLPEGVELVSGLESDELTNIKAGEPVKIAITVTGFSKEKSQVILFNGNLEIGQNRLSQSALISSRPEDFPEHTAFKKMQAVQKAMGGGIFSSEQKPKHDEKH